MANRHDRISSSNRKREMDIMRLIPRYSYMEKIINVIGTPDIKVITGVMICLFLFICIYISHKIDIINVWIRLKFLKQYKMKQGSE